MFINIPFHASKNISGTRKFCVNVIYMLMPFKMLVNVNSYIVCVQNIILLNIMAIDKVWIPCVYRSMDVSHKYVLIVCITWICIIDRCIDPYCNKLTTYFASAVLLLLGQKSWMNRWWGRPYVKRRQDKHMVSKRRGWSLMSYTLLCI